MARPMAPKMEHRLETAMEAMKAQLMVPMMGYLMEMN